MVFELSQIYPVGSPFRLASAVLLTCHQLFLLSGAKRCSKLIGNFFAIVLESTMSLRRLVPFSGEWYLENKFHVLIAIEVSLFPSPLILCIFTSLFICLLEIMSSYQHLKFFSSTTGFILFFPPFPHLLFPPPTVRKLVPIILDIFTYLINPLYVTNFQLLLPPWALAATPSMNVLLNLLSSDFGRQMTAIIAIVHGYLLRYF